MAERQLFKNAVSSLYQSGKLAPKLMDEFDDSLFEDLVTFFYAW